MKVRVRVRIMGSINPWNKSSWLVRHIQPRVPAEQKIHIFFALQKWWPLSGLNQAVCDQAGWCCEPPRHAAAPPLPRSNTYSFVHFLRLSCSLPASGSLHVPFLSLRILFLHSVSIFSMPTKCQALSRRYFGDQDCDLTRFMFYGYVRLIVGRVKQIIQ